MGTVSFELRVTIERLAEQLRRTSPMAHIARAGRFTPAALALYLESLRHLFVASQRNLGRANTLAQVLGDARLAEYFARKLAEERGHEVWASADLSQLPASSTERVEPARAILRLTDLQETLLARHPLYFVAYALWAEYFTVLVGDEWIEALGHSGYREKQLSAVVNHVHADREHARASFAQLDELWRGEPSLEQLCAAVEEAAHEFENFCNELCAATGYAA
jgi:hypothetical protein